MTGVRHDDAAHRATRSRDRDEIDQAMLRYFWGADRGEPDLVSSAFAPNGKLFVDGVQRRGPGAESPDQLPDPNGVPMDRILATTHHRHHSDVRFVDVDNALSETVATAYLLVADDDRRRLLVRGLRYLDHFSRVHGQWRIIERRHNVDWMYEAEPLIFVRRDERESFDGWLSRHRATAT